MTPEVSIERFARLRAEVERSGNLERVLERAGISPDEWTAIERHWQSALAREVASGGSDLRPRYLEAFGARGPAADGASEPASPPFPEGRAPVQISVPSYLAARPVRFQADLVAPSVLSAPVPVPPPAVARPQAAVGGPEVQHGLPVLSVEQYAWVTATLRKTTASDLDETLARLRLTAATRALLEDAWGAHMDANPEVRAAFLLALDSLTASSESHRASGPIPAPPILSSPSNAELPAPLQVDETRIAPLNAGAGPALPFAPGGRSVGVKPAAASPPAAIPSPLSNAELPAPLQVDETRIAPLNGGAGPVLPFASGGRSVGVKPATAAAPPAAPPAAATPMRPSARAGFTVAGSTVAGSSGARPSLPFARGAAPNPKDLPPGWTLARYATLCFDLHASGLSEAEVLAMAQLTNPQRLALDAYWQRRMTDEPELRAEWKTVADRREAELAKRRGGGR